MPEKVIALSVHRFADGTRRPLGDRRLLWKHKYANVQDEEQTEFSTTDGGWAWAVGAGPPGSMRDTDWANFDVLLTPELASLLHRYADEGGFVIAVWPSTEYSVYEWDARATDASDEAAIQRSVPTATFATSSAPATDVPPEWPRPSVCATAAELFDELSRASDLIT